MSSVRSDRPFRVLFVCTGNTCRSPMAEVVARREVERLGLGNVEVASAGVAAVSGAPASEGALRAVATLGLDLSTHRSRRLTAETVAAADLVLTMSASHAERAEALGGEGKVHTLVAFALDRPDVAGNVPDPFGGDDGIYLDTLRALEELVAASLGRLEVS